MERMHNIFSQWAKSEKKTELASEKVELGYMDTVKGMVKTSKEKYDFIKSLSAESKDDIKILNKESQELEAAKKELKEVQEKISKLISQKESISKKLRNKISRTKYSTTIFSLIEDLENMIKITQRHQKEFVQDAKNLGLNPSEGPLAKMFTEIFQFSGVISGGKKAARALHTSREEAEKILNKN